MKNKFAKNLILYLSIITCFIYSQASYADTPNPRIPSWHFDTNILKNTKEARKNLIQEGFTEINIPINTNQEPMSPEQIEQVAQERFAQIKQIINNPQAQAQAKNNPQTQETMQQYQNLTIENVREMISEEYANQQNQQKNQPESTIKGLFLERPNSRATIIFTPGFWPGNKEGFSPFVKIAPQDCNLLFLELSGHGESPSKSFCSNASSCLGTPDIGSYLPSLPEGITNNSLLKSTIFLLGLKEYGLNEHNEIIAAISHTSKQLSQNKPIILFGWCSGAFISARTLIKLKEMSTAENDLIKNFNIQGLIFDSGFASVTDIMPNAKGYIKKTFFKGIFSSIADFMIKWLIIAPAKLIFGPSVRENNLEINLYDKIQAISDIKTFFIHSTNDSLAPIENIKQLSNSITNKEFWETEGDQHAKNQLVYKEQYKTKLENWLNNTIKYTAPKTQSNNTTNNKKELNKNIKRMIEITNTLINNIKTNKQPDEKIFSEFMTLLQDKETNIPANTQNEITQKLSTLQSAKTPEEQIKTLEEIKDILINIKPEDNIDKNGQQKDIDKNNIPQEKNKNNYSQNQNYQNPQQIINNPNSASNPEQKTNPSYYPNNNGQSSSSPSSSPSRSEKSNSGRPSGYQSPSTRNNSYGNGSNGGGYSDYNNYQNSKENINNEKPNLTAGEYFMLDIDYDEDMNDIPDIINWYARR